jgi:hypothetical protein
MANWAFVENNEVKELHDLLPENWRNVSGLNLSQNDTAFLQSLGWYRVEKQYQQYDSSLYYINGYQHEFKNNKVIESCTLDDLQPGPTIEQLNQDELQRLRERRNKLIAESDWSQLLDVQASMQEIQKQQWSTYRQALRDLPARYLNIGVLFNIDNIEWPTKP